jgi:glycosyltransferase involved in cell wall biosynthesis
MKNFENIKISVILPVHRKDQYLDKSINSILNQTHSNIELLIILNGLNAPSIKEIKNITMDDKRVQYYTVAIADLSFALNLGIEYSTSKYIARMDSDDIAELNRLETQLEYLIVNNLEGCGSNVRLIDKHDNAIGFYKYPNSKNIKLKKYFMNPFCHPTLMIEKKILINIGGYSGSQHSEDYNLILRVLNDKYKFDNINANLLNYRIHNSHGQRKRITYAECASYQLKYFMVSFNLLAMLGLIYWLLKTIFLGRNDKY